MSRVERLSWRSLTLYSDQASNERGETGTSLRSRPLGL
jgi:hypothetical protein